MKKLLIIPAILTENFSLKVAEDKSINSKQTLSNSIKIKKSTKDK